MAITTMKQFAAKARSASTNATKARDALQECLLFAIQQAHDHGNTTPATQLAVKYLPNTGMRRKDALAYLYDHAPIRWDDKAKLFKLAKSRKVGTLEDARKVAWYEYAREGNADPAAFNPLRDLKSTISSLKRKAEKASENNSPALAELYGKMVAEAQKELEYLQQAIERARAAEAANTAANKAAVNAH